MVSNEQSKTAPLHLDSGRGTLQLVDGRHAVDDPTAYTVQAIMDFEPNVCADAVIAYTPRHLQPASVIMQVDRGELIDGVWHLHDFAGGDVAVLQVTGDLESGAEDHDAAVNVRVSALRKAQ